LTGDDIKQVKEKFGFSPEESYVVPKEVSTQEEKAVG
jgi:transketolase